MQKQILYPFLSDNKKIQVIFSILSQSDYVDEIIKNAKKIGCKVDFQWFGTPAAYYPKIITLEENENISDIISLRSENNIQAHFSFSRRFGLFHHCHHFIHELLHFAQDLNGEFSIPILKKNQTAEILSEEDYIYNYLHLEAMAAIQAIQISYDLYKDHNSPYAWWGCYYSFDWYSLSKRYMNLIKNGKSKPYAFEACYQAWFETKQKNYASDIAQKNYQHLNQMITQHNKAITKEYS